MIKKIFLVIEIGDTKFYQGLWDNLSEAKEWAREYHSENPTAKFTAEIIHIVS